ncbi:type II toxin-antitoxin system YhaV family toxin [Shewanella algae]
MEVIQKNGYELHCLSIFEDILEKLVAEVEHLASTQDDFYSHPRYKLFEDVTDVITSRVPSNPNAQEFRQGKTLDKSAASCGKAKYLNWRRVKSGLPNRYRLFYRYNSTPPKSIVYAWLNDESTLRKEGSKTDVYVVFAHMLSSGTVPNSWKELIECAEPLKQGA